MTKKIIALLLIVSINISLIKPVNVMANPVVAAGELLIELLMSMAASQAVSLANDKPLTADTAWLQQGQMLIAIDSLMDFNNAMVVEGVKVFRDWVTGDNNQKEEFFVYDGSYFTLKMESIRLKNGMDVIPNPLLIKKIADKGLLDKFVECLHVFKNLGVRSIYEAKQRIDMILTNTQKTISDAVKTAIGNVTSIIIKASEISTSLYTPEEVLEFTNNSKVQRFRYNQHTNSEIYNLLSDYPFYLMGIYHGDEIYLLMSRYKMDIYRFPNGSKGININDYYVIYMLNNDGTYSQINRSGLFTLKNYLFCDPKSYEMLCVEYTFYNRISSFPYTLDSSDTLIGNSATRDKIYSNLYSGDVKPIASNPTNTYEVIDQSIKEDIAAGQNITFENSSSKTANLLKESVGVETEAEPLIKDNVDLTNIATNVSDMAVLLYQINNNVVDIYSQAGTNAKSIVDGIVAGANASFQKYFEKDGKSVFLETPAMLTNIYGELIDTGAVTDVIAEQVGIATEGVKTIAQSITQSRAITDEVAQNLPNGSGGIFRAISMLIVILILLLYLFLRVLQFIVLLFKVPASTVLFPPLLVQGLDYLKTTKLIGNKDALLTFDTVSSANKIGFDISIWGFFIGLIDIMILFYIIKQIRRHVEKIRS